MACVLFLVLAGSGQARVKLVALPDRDKVSVRLTGSGAALVEEERVLTLQKGTNHVDFSWKAVSIDPASLRFDPLDHPAGVRVVRVAYPPGENALVWQVYAEQAYQERVRIGYLLSGLSRQVSYRGRVAADEKTLSMSAWLEVDNQSGEDFDRVGLAMGYDLEAEKRLRTGESRKLLAFELPSVPVVKAYRWDSARHPHEPEKVGNTVGIPVAYRIPNQPAVGLGSFPLERGKFRLFQVDAQGTEVFLGEDWAAFTPVGGDLEVGVGDTRDLKVTRRVMRRELENRRTNKRGRGVLHDRREWIRYEIENFKKDPVRLTLVEHLDPGYEIEKATFPARRVDSRTSELELQVAPTPGGEQRKPMVVSFEVVTRNVKG